MTREISGHDVWPGPGLFPFFDQVGKCLIHKRLELAAFLLRDRADRGQNHGIDLGSEFFTRLRHVAVLLNGTSLS